MFKYSIAARVDPDMAMRATLLSRINKLEWMMTREKKWHILQRARRENRKLKNQVKLLVKYPPKVTQFKNKYGTTAEHMTRIFGYYTPPRPKKYDPENEDQVFIQNYMLKLKNATKQSRIYELAYRLESEMTLAANFGHFIVFNTLTVTNENMDFVFQKNSPAWRSYIARWHRSTTNHRYFACVEEGAKNGRLHIHIIHIFNTHIMRNSSLPDDPNAGKENPYYRVIDKYRAYWKYGFSTPIAVRTKGLDAWARIGFRWPTKKKSDSSPIPAKPPAALARYMTKYLLKAYETPTRSKQLWKTRITHSLGLLPIRRILSEMTTQQTCKAMLNPLDLTLFQQPDDRRIPKHLMIREAHRTVLKTMTIHNLQTKLNMLATLKAQPSIKQRLQTLIQRKGKTSSLSSIINLTTLNLTSMDIFNIKFIFQNVTDYYYGNQYSINPSGVTVRRT